MNAAPMLGARCANSGFRPYSRRGTKQRPWTQDERRVARLAERELWLFDLACEFVDVVETIEFHDEEFAEVLVDLLTGCPDGPACDYEGCPVSRANIARKNVQGTYHANASGGFWA